MKARIIGELKENITSPSAKDEELYSGTVEKEEKISDDAAKDIKSLLKEYVVDEISGGTVTINDIKSEVDTASKNIDNINNEIQAGLSGSNISDIVKYTKDLPEKTGSIFNEVNDIHRDIQETKTAVGENAKQKSLLNVTRTLNYQISSNTEKIKAAIDKLATKRAFMQETEKLKGEVSEIRTAVGNIATEETLLKETKKINDDFSIRADKLKEILEKSAAKSDLKQTETKILTASHEIKTSMATSLELTNQAQNLKTEIGNFSNDIKGKFDCIINADEADRNRLKPIIDDYPLWKKLVIASLSVGALNFLGIVALIVMQVMG